jgi:hypothetical protein
MSLRRYAVNTPAPSTPTASAKTHDRGSVPEPALARRAAVERVLADF